MGMTQLHESGNQNTNFTNLQNAMNAALSGDIIELDAGMICYSSSVLSLRIPCLNLSAPVTVRSAGLTALPVGKRVNPGQVGSMASVYAPSNVNGQYSLSAALYAGIDLVRPANNFTFQGINFRMGAQTSLQNALVWIGSNSPNVWQIRFSGVTGGSFKLTYNGVQTGIINYSTTQNTLQLNMANALKAIGAQGPLAGISIQSIGPNDYYISLYDAPVGILSAQNTALTGSTPTVTIYSGGGTFHAAVNDRPTDQPILPQYPTGPYLAEVPQGGDHCPYNIIIDRCLIWSGFPGVGGQQIKLGLYMNGNNCTVANSYVYDIKRNDNECHGVQVTQTQTGFQFCNNYCEATTENFFVGGEAPSNYAVPANGLVQYNLFSKPLSWNPLDPSYDGSEWWIKNIFELKNGTGWNIDNNTFQNCWAARDQRGHAILFTPRGTGLGQGNGNATVANVTFTNNHILHTLCGFDIAGAGDDGGSLTTHDVLIQNNLIEDILDHVTLGDTFDILAFGGDRDSTTVVNANSGSNAFHPGKLLGYATGGVYFSLLPGLPIILNYSRGAPDLNTTNLASPPGRAERVVINGIAIDRAIFDGSTITAYDGNGQPSSFTEPTGGTFRVGYQNNYSAAIAFNASAAAIQTALRAVPSLGGVTVSGGPAGSSNVTVDIPSPISSHLQFDNSALTGGGYGVFYARGTFSCNNTLTYNCPVAPIRFGIRESPNQLWFAAILPGAPLPGQTPIPPITTTNLTFDHNTMTTVNGTAQPGASPTALGFLLTFAVNGNQKHHNFTFTNNIMSGTLYGIRDYNPVFGLAALQQDLDQPNGGTFLNNAIYGTDQSTGSGVNYGPGYLAALPDTSNKYVTQAVGTGYFTNWANGKGGNYKLASGPWINGGTDGKDIGTTTFSFLTDGNSASCLGNTPAPGPGPGPALTWNRINLVGFETGDASEIISGVGGTLGALLGTASIVSAPVNPPSVYAMRSNPVTTAIGGCAVVAPNSQGFNSSPFSVATVFYRFYFRYAVKPVAADEEICFFYDTPNGLHKGSLRLNSAGKIAAYTSDDTTVLATGNTVLAVNTWYRIEVKWSTGANAAWELRINGVTEISGTGNLGANANGWLGLGKLHDRNGNTVDFFYDDVAIDSNTFPGPGSVICLHPNADGMYVQWTQNGVAPYYTKVNDTVPDNGATYVQDATAGDIYTVRFVSSAAAGLSGSQIYAIKACVMVADNAAGASSVQIRLRSGTQNADLTASTVGLLNATYMLMSMMDNTDPATGNAWTQAGIDGIEAGVVNAVSQSARLSYVSMMVDFVQTSLPLPPSLGISIDAVRVPMAFKQLVL